MSDAGDDRSPHENRSDFAGGEDGDNDYQYESTGGREGEEPPEPSTSYAQEIASTDERPHDEGHSGDYSQDSGGNRGETYTSGGFPEAGEGCKLFIAQLNYDTKEDAMRETFGKFGKVTDCNIARQPGGISRGFGFVTFDDARDAEEARERMHQSIFDGREIKVQIADNRARGDGAEKRPPPPVGGDPCKLFIGGLAWATTSISLRKTFEDAVGEVAEARVICDKEDPTKSRGFGFVTMATPELAQAAHKTFHGQELDGRELRVDFDTGQRNNAPSGGGGKGGYGGKGGGYGGKGDSYYGGRDDRRDYRQPAGYEAGYRGSGYADSRGGGAMPPRDRGGSYAAPNRGGGAPVQQSYDDHRGGGGGSYASRAPAAGAYDDRGSVDSRGPPPADRYAARGPPSSTSYDERPPYQDGLRGGISGGGPRDGHRDDPRLMPPPSPSRGSYYKERSPPRYEQHAPPPSRGGGYTGGGGGAPYREDYRSVDYPPEYRGPPPRGYDAPPASSRYEQGGGGHSSSYRSSSSSGGGPDVARAAPVGYQQPEYRAPPGANYQPEYRAAPNSGGGSYAQAEYRGGDRAAAAPRGADGNYRYDSARAGSYSAGPRGGAPPPNGGGGGYQEYRGSSGPGSQGSHGGGSYR